MGWIHFLKLNSASIKANNPHADSKEVRKLASVKWKHLPEHWRMAYVSEAANLVSPASKDVSSPSFTPSGHHEPDEPKKHTAWTLFLKDELRQRTPTPKGQFGKVIREIAQKWNSRDTGTENKYKELAAQDHDQWLQAEEDYRLLYRVE